MNGNSVSQRCLLTGATGFIGSHLAHVLADGGWEVHAVLRASSDAAPLKRKENPIALHRYDGSIQSILDIVHSACPRIVFHLASYVQAEHQPKDIGPMIESNVLFGAQLLEAMQCEGVEYMVNTSTAWQHYGQQEYSPTCLYAATKQAFEVILAYYAEVRGLRAITLTVFDTYGPHDRRRKLLQLLREASTTREVLQLTPGEQWVDLVHIDDVVRGYMIAADRLLRGISSGSQKFALSSGSPIQLKDFISRYEQATGHLLRIAWGAKPYRPREMMEPWRGGIPLPGWQPRINLEEGLRAMECIGDGED